jgi:hypothetical protein
VDDSVRTSPDRRTGILLRCAVHGDYHQLEGQKLRKA